MKAPYVEYHTDGWYGVYQDANGQWHTSGPFTDPGDAESAANQLGTQWGWPGGGGTVPPGNTGGTGTTPGAQPPGGGSYVGGQIDPAIAQGDLLLRQFIAYMNASGNLPPDFFSGSPGAGGPSAEDSAIDYIISTKPDLITALGNMGQDVSTPEAKRAAIRTWWSEASPNENTGGTRSLSDYAGSLGWTAPAGGTTGGTTPGGRRTLEGNKWDFFTGTQFPWEQEKYRGDFGERQRQFNQQFGENQRQFNIGTLSGLTGPRDWLRYQAAQSALGPEAGTVDNLANIFWNTPSFGPMTPTASWEEALRNYQQTMEAGPVGQGPSPDYEGGKKVVPPSPRTDLYPTQSVRRLGDNTTTPPQSVSQMPTVSTGISGEGTVSPTAPPWLANSTKGTLQQNSASSIQGTSPLARASAEPGYSAGTGTGSAGQIARPPVGDWRGQFFQPTQITAQVASRLTPTQRAMLEGSWSAYGVSPEDAWTKAQRSWIGSGGPVASGTRYRSFY